MGREAGSRGGADARHPQRAGTGMGFRKHSPRLQHVHLGEANPYALHYSPYISSLG